MIVDNGEVYSWGGGGVSYNKGQCGHGDLKDYDTPKRIEYFKNKNEDVANLRYKHHL